jgi:hypothetical protein
MIWQIDAVVVDASFWGTSLPTQRVILAAVRSVQKRENNSYSLSIISSDPDEIISRPGR